MAGQTQKQKEAEKKRKQDEARLKQQARNTRHYEKTKALRLADPHLFACTFEGCPYDHTQPLASLQALKKHVKTNHLGMMVGEEKTEEGSYILEVVGALPKEFAQKKYDVVVMAMPTLNMSGQLIGGLGGESESPLRWTDEVPAVDVKKGVWSVDLLKEQFHRLKDHFDDGAKLFVVALQQQLGECFELLNSWGMKYLGIEKFIHADIDGREAYGKPSQVQWVSISAQPKKELLRTKIQHLGTTLEALAQDGRSTGFQPSQDPSKEESKEDLLHPAALKATAWQNHFRWLMFGGRSQNLHEEFQLRRMEKDSENFEVLTLFWYGFKEHPINCVGYNIITHYLHAYVLWYPSLVT